MTKQAYFLTVDWCNSNRRGIFCKRQGQGYWKKDEPHTADEMGNILGPFDMILNPKSELLTIDQVKEYTQWIPLAEYSYEFGIAVQRNEAAVR